jgi:hypothetical protein
VRNRQLRTPPGEQPGKLSPQSRVQLPGELLSRLSAPQSGPLPPKLSHRQLSRLRALLPPPLFGRLPVRLLRPLPAPLLTGLLSVLLGRQLRRLSARLRGELSRQLRTAPPRLDCLPRHATVTTMKGIITPMPGAKLPTSAKVEKPWYLPNHP